MEVEADRVVEVVSVSLAESETDIDGDDDSVVVMDLDLLLVLEGEFDDVCGEAVRDVEVDVEPTEGDTEAVCTLDTVIEADSVVVS
jgi:hypothetical protein